MFDKTRKSIFCSGRLVLEDGVLRKAVKGLSNMSRKKDPSK
jgi:hypothetical protein